MSGQLEACIPDIKDPRLQAMFCLRYMLQLRSWSWESLLVCFSPGCLRIVWEKYGFCMSLMLGWSSPVHNDPKAPIPTNSMPSSTQCTVLQKARSMASSQATPFCWVASIQLYHIMGRVWTTRLTICMTTRPGYNVNLHVLGWGYA